MLTRHHSPDVVWIDLESPTLADVRTLVEEFGIDALTAEELLFATARERLEIHDHYLYIVLHFPALRHTHMSKEQELDCIIGDRFIITAHYEPIDALHKFSKVFEADLQINRDMLSVHAGYLFFSLVKKMYRSIEHEIGATHDVLREIEARIFAGREREMVIALSGAARDLLNLRQTLEPHRDVLTDLDARGRLFFPADLHPYIRALLNEYYRVHNHVMRHLESVRELRETNNSLLYTKQNEVMKILTIMAFVTFPLTLIAGIFGMNTTHTPIVGDPNDFWIILGAMGISTAFMFWYFKYKKWL